MIARCHLCRGFVEVARVPDHPARVGSHPDARIALPTRGVMWKATSEADRAGAPVCAGGGAEAAPLLVYVAHPVAPPAIVPDLRSAAIVRFAGDHEADVAANLYNAGDWYAWALRAMPWLDLVMPWRPLLDALDELDVEQRAHGVRISVAAAARCDVLAIFAKRTKGIDREAAGIEATGGRVVDLVHLGLTPPAPGAVVNLPELLAG